MRIREPFRASDLESLDELFSSVREVVPMRDVYEGERSFDVIALRHDVDDNAGSWRAAVEMARWEFDHGYRATYFLLHSASYWGQPGFWSDVKHIAAMGHEIGIHANAIATAIRRGNGANPALILCGALSQLRAYSGVEVIGEVAHGDELCRNEDGELLFVNDEMFVECARPEVGAPDRVVKGTELKLEPFPLSDFDLKYDANRLGRKFYASDSGGEWSLPWREIVRRGRSPEGQLHMLIHPDWWTKAF